ncbi:hypothetical protein C8A00DRAFT_10851 [Chaetomidium leptoderma]|uniref:NAD-dependent epimerase/dehydratase domain-containing protein n=1 Tax=Chaetomidium leptoderma TaxID=669021 RepID=A0AAN6VVW4_9PEZI|nr:hypothetical protein C8A00DRAFT_10851 [Chaetomidium leptoderma]
MSGPEVSIPKGSLVLITGATGHVAAHTAKQFLERGYRVRGTVRDLQSAAWLTEDVFKAFADSGLLELVHVPDLGAKHAFDQAIKGASAIVHIASILTFADDPSQVIQPVVDCVTSILEAALGELSVKSFVYTSSIAAAVDINPGGVAAHVGQDSWNDHAVELAYAPPPHRDTFDRGHAVYQASKVAAEKAVWAFAEKNKPHYSVNVVSPSTVLGEGLVKRHLEIPYPWIKNLYDGNEEIGALFQAIIHIDVKDVALLHVATTLDPECNGARLQAWGEYCNMNDILAILRRMYPGRKFRDDFSNQTKLEITTEYGQQLALLKKWGGQEGWTTLEQSVADEMKGVKRWFPEI